MNLPFLIMVLSWVTKGYVVFGWCLLPIIGEGKTEPNDNFISQLIDNAGDAVDALGYIDEKKRSCYWRSFLWRYDSYLLTQFRFICLPSTARPYNRTLTHLVFNLNNRELLRSQRYTIRCLLLWMQTKWKLLCFSSWADNNPGTLQTEHYFQV
jgi:hypothetical protein